MYAYRLLRKLQNNISQSHTFIWKKIQDSETVMLLLVIAIHYYFITKPIMKTCLPLTLTFDLDSPVIHWLWNKLSGLKKRVLYHFTKALF